MRKLSDSQKIEIVQEYISGKSSVELSRIYNVSPQAILQILKVRQIEIRKK